MPTSSPEQIPTIIRLAKEVKPVLILDVGCGWGKYGWLLREYLGGYDFRTGMVISAVEPFSNYRDRDYGNWECYDEVSDCDFMKYNDPEHRFDLVLMIDVLEHWEKEEGYKALEKALRIGRKVLIATPKDPAPQGAVNGNEYERHRSRWTKKDLASFANWTDRSTNETLIGLLSSAK